MCFERRSRIIFLNWGEKIYCLYFIVLFFQKKKYLIYTDYRMISYWQSEKPIKNIYLLIKERNISMEINI